LTVEANIVADIY